MTLLLDENVAFDGGGRGGYGYLSSSISGNLYHHSQKQDSLGYIVVIE